MEMGDLKVHRAAPGTRCDEGTCTREAKIMVNDQPLCVEDAGQRLQADPGVLGTVVLYLLRASEEI